MYKFRLFSFLFILFALIPSTPVFSGELVDIGDNRKMYIECTGTGSPTVILIPGLKDRGDGSWNNLPETKGTPVFSEIGKSTRVCTYDRPGTVIGIDDKIEKSRSDPIAQPSTIKDHVKDLHALIKAAKIPGPYVIVGHSLGGLISRLYVAMYPKDICGLVLVDGTVEGLKNRLTPNQWQVFQNGVYFAVEELRSYKDFEIVDFEKSFQQLLGISMVDLWKVPTTILVSDQKIDTTLFTELGIIPSNIDLKEVEQIGDVSRALQEQLATLFSPAAKLIEKTNSGHYIQKDNPSLVVEAIRDRMKGANCKP